MTLATGSQKMIELLSKVFRLFKQRNEDVLRVDGEYWSTFKSRKKGVGFAYLQPQVNGIRVFPKLPCETLKSLSPNTLEIRTMDRSGRWGEIYKCWFRIWQTEQIPETINVLDEAYTRILSGKIGKEEQELINEEKADERTLVDTIDYRVEVSDEKQVQNYIWNNKDSILIEDGLRITDREYDTGIGFVDFFGTDKNGMPVLMEVKLNASDSAIGQLLGYMHSTKEKNNYEAVRGILVTQDFSNRVRIASRHIGIKIVRFDVELVFAEEA